ncbi:hypothetical protein BaRGS_00028530 [Batillaria attramentaria]|uniref:Ig-like domain-containing protein n=1 Tax=Batillaria attramentaria TaxID=370345 RepID=A0ABD0JZU3_9CAEN
MHSNTLYFNFEERCLSTVDWIDPHENDAVSLRSRVMSFCSAERRSSTQLSELKYAVLSRLGWRVLLHFRDYTTGQLDEHDSSATCSLAEPQSGNLYTLSVTVPANSAIYQGASVDCLPSCLDATFEYGLNTKYFGVPIHVDGPTDESMAITGPASIPTDGSQPVTLTCEVNDTYPVPRYTWTNVACDNGNKQKTCTFTPSFPGDDGQVVVCKAVNPQITLPAVENTGWAMFTLKFRAPTRNDRKCTPVGHPVLAAVLYFLYIPGPVYIMIAAAVRSKWPFTWRSLSIVFCMLIPEFMVLYVICAVIGKMWPFAWEIVLFTAGFLLCSGLVTLMTLEFVCGVPPPENCINTDSCEYCFIACLVTQ